MSIQMLSGCDVKTAKDVNRQPWQPFGAMPGVLAKYLFTSDRSVAGLMRIEPGAHEVRHLHVGGQHHVWVVEGAAIFDGVRLEPGSYLHVPEELSHTLRAAEDAGCTLFFVYARVA